jgi:hypothetical protein
MCPTGENAIEPTDDGAVRIRRDLNLDHPAETLQCDARSQYSIEVEELDRIELDAGVTAASVLPIAQA